MQRICPLSARSFHAPARRHRHHRQPGARLRARHRRVRLDHQPGRGAAVLPARRAPVARRHRGRSHALAPAPDDLLGHVPDVSAAGVALKPVLEPLVRPNFVPGRAVSLLPARPRYSRPSPSRRSRAATCGRRLPAHRPPACWASSSLPAGGHRRGQRRGRADFVRRGRQRSCCNCCCPSCWGELLRPWIGAWVHRRKGAAQSGSTGLHPAGGLHRAFSEAVSEGLWSNTPIRRCWGCWPCAASSLVLAMAGSLLLGRLFKFDVADRITLLFCGSKRAWPAVS